MRSSDEAKRRLNPRRVAARDVGVKTAVLREDQWNAGDRLGEHPVDEGGHLVGMDDLDSSASHVPGDPPGKEQVLPGPAAVADQGNAFRAKRFPEASDEIETADLDADRFAVQPARQGSDHDLRTPDRQPVSKKQNVHLFGRGGATALAGGPPQPTRGNAAPLRAGLGSCHNVFSNPFN